MVRPGILGPRVIEPLVRLRLATLWRIHSCQEVSDGPPRSGPSREPFWGRQEGARLQERAGLHGSGRFLEILGGHAGCRERQRWGSLHRPPQVLEKGRVIIKPCVLRRGKNASTTTRTTSAAERPRSADSLRLPRPMSGAPRFASAARCRASFWPMPAPIWFFRARCIAHGLA
jgi:hypothetical protein